MPLCAHQQPAPHASDQGGRAASGLAQQRAPTPPLPQTCAALHTRPKGREAADTLCIGLEWIEFMLCHGLDNTILNTHFGLPFCQ